MFDLRKTFKNKIKTNMSKDEIAHLLNTNPKAYEIFESKYRLLAMDCVDFSNTKATEFTPEQKNLISRIEAELLSQVRTYIYEPNRTENNGITVMGYDIADYHAFVTLEEIRETFKDNAPQVTAFFQKRDIKDKASVILMEYLKTFMDDAEPVEKRRLSYNMFRQGLDILDIDGLMYEMIDCNVNSMGYWLPEIIAPVRQFGFFKIPETRIMKVPMNVLQLTRCEYGELTCSTMEIVNGLCKMVFHLDPDKEYFIKTGTYSSKFDFRNAHINGADEVNTIGEYFLFNHGRACQMAGPLNIPCIYGMSTTTEWVVREYIQDKEDNPCIYKGLPLHTEYRVFVDFDTNEILSIVPYWEPNTMKERFGDGADRNIHDLHDYAIYKKHESVLMERYNNNFSKVKSEIEKFIPEVKLSGQWSIDIMQNGDDFWLIDMALAQNSMFKESIPINKRHTQRENWLPDLSKTKKGF